MNQEFSVLDIFNAATESLADAKTKLKQESQKKTEYLRLQKDGKYELRVLPIAPEIGPDGNVLPLSRKGYEYPAKEMVLKFTTDKGSSYVSVSNAKHVLKDLDEDLIDAYIRIASTKYANDNELIKKIRSNSFSGGLRYDSKRCMYVLDLKNREAGPQVFQLSYSQYKDVEERKIEIWERLGSESHCPLSSPGDGFPLLITRSTENRKTNYKVTIDTFKKEPLTEDELKALMDAPRLPEVIYRYSRYHFEAVVAFLKNYDAMHRIAVMETEEMKAAVEKVKMLLPADDTSHFVLGGGEGADGDGTISSVADLLDIYENLKEQGLDDKSEEGQELRASIKEYVEERDYEIIISRSKSNEDLLKEIEKIEGTGESASVADEEFAPKGKERNDDTSEPAARQTKKSGLI